MLTCYLDDSGKDPQNPITTVAGYIARDSEWAIFEQEVERWFSEFGVGVLHSKDMRNGDGDFKGWKVLRKHTFVARLCHTLSQRAIIAYSASAKKDAYKIGADASGRKRIVTPYTFCFNLIIDWILRGVLTGKAAHVEGVAFVLEAGHENNPEAQEQFHAVVDRHDLRKIVRSISFVPKTECRAIQMADLFAFYTRRDGVARLKAMSAGADKYKIDTMIKIITEGMPYHVFVATGFEPSPPGLPSWRPPG